MPTGQVDVLIRPERLHLVEQGGGADNVFDMLIDDVINYGDSLLAIGKTRGLPIRKNIVGGCCRRWYLRGQYAQDHIGTLNKVGIAGDHNCWANLGLLGATQRPNNYVARSQRDGSSSSVSSRRRDATVNSRRSDSDQESDQSIAVMGARSASR